MNKAQELMSRRLKSAREPAAISLSLPLLNFPLPDLARCY
jgi:hypothetical protein